MPAIGFGNPYTDNRLRNLYLNTPMPPSLGGMSAPKRGLGQIVSDAVAGKLKPVVGKRIADKAATLVDYSPVGAGTQGFQFGQDLRHGDWLSALGNGLSTAMNMLPDGGALAAKGGAGMLHSIIAPLFHGSPHKFEKFAWDDAVRGSGEGAQAYGDGLYFAENPQVAKQYQALVTMQHAGINWDTDPASLAKYWIGMNGGDRNAATRTFESIKQQQQRILDYAATGRPMAAGAADNSRTQIANADAAIAHIKAGTEAKPGGHLYEVKLDANPEDFLNWDSSIPDLNKASPRDKLVDDYKAAMLNRHLGNPNDVVRANQELLRQGIPGIRYLDQGSRGAGNGTSNYVVFDPSIIDITHRH